MIRKSALCFLLLLFVVSKVFASEVEYITVTQVVSAVSKTMPDHQLGSFTQMDGLQTFLSKPVVVPLKKERPFVALVIQWEVPYTEAPQLAFSVRSSEDGIRWTEWYNVVEDPHAPVGLNRFSGDLLFLPANAQWVQYRVAAHSHLASANPQLDKVFLQFINPGITPPEIQEEMNHSQVFGLATEENKKIKTNNAEVASTQNAYTLPEYIDRVKWGGTLNLTNSAPRTPTSVTHLIVHHSAGQNTSSDFAAVVRSYYILHTQTNGWTDIGYNWLIDRNGVLYQGRAFDVNGSIDVVGAHLGGGNTNTMGVCLIGDFTSIQPATVALTQLRNVLAWKANERKIDVRSRQSHTLGNLFTISGHRDGVATECPGNAFYPRLPEIRTQVYAYLNPPQLLSNKVMVVSSNPSEARFELEIHPKGSNVVGYLEYGTNADQLTSKTPLFEIKASESATKTNLTVSNLTAGTRYHYRVVASNSEIVNKFEVSSFVAGVTTSEVDPTEVPLAYVLSQNFPNPFNPSTTIEYQLPTPGMVKIVVYNLFGQAINVVGQGYKQRGKHSINFDGTGLASGVWYYALEVNGQLISTKKMTLLK